MSGGGGGRKKWRDGGRKNALKSKIVVLINWASMVVRT